MRILIAEDSLAEGILQAGDVLIWATLHNRTVQITRQYHVIDMMLDVRVGDVVSFCVLRDGEDITVSITITQDCLTAY